MSSYPISSRVIASYLANSPSSIFPSRLASTCCSTAPRSSVSSSALGCACSHIIPPSAAHCKKYPRTSTDILRRVFHILTEPRFRIQYVCVRINRRNNKAPAHVAMWARDSLFRRFTYTEPVQLKYGKLAAKYSWIYLDIFFTLHKLVVMDSSSQPAST